jgi:outer membrane protein assembly factor BamB
LLLIALCEALQAKEPPATWPQWRGPTRDSHVTAPEWPDTLKGDALQQLWRVKLGDGYSGPIVSEDRVFVVESRDGTLEVVRALDRKTGKQLWETSWKGTITVPSYAQANGEWVRSTPAFDGKSLYIGGLRDVVVCLDAANGKERWGVDFVERYKTPVPPYGFACSPLVDGEFVYVQAGAAFVKLEKKTGKVVWRVLPYKSTTSNTAVSSPVVVTLAGKRQLVVQQPKLLAGVDMDSGAVLWSQPVPAFRGFNIITPTQYRDGILTSAFGGRTFLFKVSRKGQEFEASAAWDNKSQGYMSSPVVIGDHVYMHLRNQRFICADLKTGEKTWTSERSYGQYWSMVVNKDRILALDQRGLLFLLKADPKEFKLLDERKLSESDTWAHLAVCGDELFIREQQAIAAYRWQSVKPRP